MVFPTGLSLVLGSDGALAISLSVVDPNGSSLRHAMDGDFVPLIDSLPVNASQQAALLAQITTAETTPLLSGYFGNRDGTVEPSEVSLFTTLIQQGARYLPSGTLTAGNLLGVQVDGKNASAAQLAGVTFAGAAGPVSSSLPLTVTSTLADQFALGSGSNTLRLIVSLPIGGSLVAVAVPPLNLTFQAPSGTTITSVSGLGSVSTHNDALGWGSPTTSGTYAPLSNSTLLIAFGPAFPVGDVVIGAGAAAALVAIGFVLWLRHRRRARAALAPPAPIPAAPQSEATGGVGPSGSA